MVRHCRESIFPGGRLYVVERLVQSANVRDPAKWDDLNMLVMMGGRERTLVEFRGLLTEAGFAKITLAGEGIIEAEAGD